MSDRTSFDEASRLYLLRTPPDDVSKRGNEDYKLNGKAAWKNLELREGAGMSCCSATFRFSIVALCPLVDEGGSCRLLRCGDFSWCTGNVVVPSSPRDDDGKTFRSLLPCALPCWMSSNSTYCDGRLLACENTAGLKGRWLEQLPVCAGSPLVAACAFQSVQFLFS